MADEPVEFSPENVERLLREFYPQYGCLSIMSENGQSAEWGTAVCASYRGRKYLITAKHVTDKLFMHSREIDVGFASEPKGASLTMFFKVHRSNLRVEHQDLDVAILDAPEDLQRSPVPRWFDLDEGIASISRLRSQWSSAGQPQAVISAGFAKFTNIRGKLDSGQLIEARGVAVCGVQIKELAPNPDGSPLSVSLVISSPIVSIDGHDPGSPIARLAVQAQEIVQANPAFEIEDLQGMSGGPIVILRNGTLELLGVIYQGPKTKPWDQLVDAIPLDEIDLSAL